MEDYILKMEKYIEDFKNLSKDNPEQAKKEAREALIRTGVLNLDGTPKKQIVNR